jgi:hypothetical protein
VNLQDIFDSKIRQKQEDINAVGSYLYVESINIKLIVAEKRKVVGSE